MRRTFSVLSVALALACLAAVSASAGAAGGGTVTIGISLSLSGDFSDSGKAAMRGYQLWASVVNAHGGLQGKQVKLKIVDDTSSPTQVVTNYQNLITHDKVAFTFGPFSTLLTAPAATYTLATADLCRHDPACRLRAESRVFIAFLETQSSQNRCG